jgi:hypothetical protein
MADFYGGNELIYDIQSGSIMAGGYKIESTSMMHNFEGGGSKDGKNDNDSKDNEKYIIPIGLINFNIKNKSTFNILNSSDILSHDLYDNLLNLVNIDPKPLHNITKKNRSSSKSSSKSKSQKNRN